MSIVSSVRFVCEEIGLTTLVNSSRDVFLIIILRMIRLLGFGATSLILVLFLKELGIHEEYIGIFMTLTFIGDLVSSFLFSLAADKLGRKFTLSLSSIIMLITGISFSVFNNYYLLALISILGILTPGGGEVGPFRSIEQSSIATLCSYNERSDIYAWYTFSGTFCAALGSIFGGFLIQFTSNRLNYSILASYKAVFLGYAFISLLSFIICLFLTDRIELSNEDKTTADESSNDTSNETTPLNQNENSPLIDQPKKKSRFLPELNHSVYSIVFKLSILFAIDSFASSLVSMSWQTYYVKQKFKVSPSYLGSIFFVTGIVSSIMSLLGTSLTKRLGAVVTMVVTHLPASILLALVPIPNSLKITLIILIIRASTQSMDVAPKHVFLATLVPSKDRTAVFAWTNVVKTLAQVAGPTMVGYLTNTGLQWLTFILAGSLKALYDIGILATFLTFNRHNQH